MKAMRRVLIVDDAATVRLYYRQVLGDSEFSIQEAANGCEGLERLAEDEFELLIVDVNMPKMDGFTFLQKVRSSKRQAAVPAIMISTQANEVDRQLAFRSGANLYLVKPVTPEVLVNHARLMTGLSAGGRS